MPNYYERRIIHMANLSDANKHQYAKSFTEFAIQQDVFSKYEDPTKTAEEIAKFFNTLVAKLGEDE